MHKPSHFVQACRRIEGAIEYHTRAGSGSHKTRTKLRRELAFWLTTFHSYNSYPTLPKMRLPWAKWDETHGIDALRLAFALRLKHRHEMSRSKVMANSGCSRSTLSYALDLVNDVGLHLHDVVSDQNDVVEAHDVAHVRHSEVRLEARALQDLLLGAAEGYRVPQGKGFKYAEVYGLRFGGSRGRPGRDDAREQLVHVSRVATQLRAKGTASSVMPNAKSMKTQLDVATQFFPHLEIVGDYHTHPYDSLSELKRCLGLIRSRGRFDYAAISSMDSRFCFSCCAGLT